MMRYFHLRFLSDRVMSIYVKAFWVKWKCQNNVSQTSKKDDLELRHYQWTSWLFMNGRNFHSWSWQMLLTFNQRRLHMSDSWIMMSHSLWLIGTDENSIDMTHISWLSFLLTCRFRILAGFTSKKQCNHLTKFVRLLWRTRLEILQNPHLFNWFNCSILNKVLNHHF